jgi:hypothetical protein
MVALSSAIGIGDPAMRGDALRHFLERPLMPSLERAAAWGVYTPEQLAALRAIFEETCASLALDTDSPEADRIAAKIFTAFKLGYVDKETMLASLLGTSNEHP